MELKNEVVEEGLAICEENILVQCSAKSCEDIIRKLGVLLHNNGYVKESFTQAVLDREKIYPTGLQTNTVGFAIPHTDVEHVLKASLAIATLQEPVLFRAMDNSDVNVPVTIVMMLAIQDPKKVVQTLRSVISILENEEALASLTQAASSLEVKDIVRDHIKSLANRISQSKP
jgi:PTS system galactitol-specific IIA component